MGCSSAMQRQISKPNYCNKPSLVALTHLLTWHQRRMEITGHRFQVPNLTFTDSKSAVLVPNQQFTAILVPTSVFGSPSWLMFFFVLRCLFLLVVVFSHLLHIVTLISVTICSLIFFICTLKFVFRERPLPWKRLLVVLKFKLKILINLADFQLVDAYDHTTMNTPVLVWSRKSSIVGPG